MAPERGHSDHTKLGRARASFGKDKIMRGYSRLDFPGRDSGALVIMSQARRLACDALENVTDKRIHDAHGL